MHINLNTPHECRVGSIPTHPTNHRSRLYRN